VTWFFDRSGLVAGGMPGSIRKSLVQLRASMGTPVPGAVEVVEIVGGSAFRPAPRHPLASRPWWRRGALIALVTLAPAVLAAVLWGGVYWQFLLGYPEKEGEWKWSDVCNEHLRDDRLLLAEKTCRRGLEVSPLKPIVKASLHYKLGLIAEKRGNDVEALSFVSRSLGMYPPESGLRATATRDLQRICLKSGAPALLPGDTRKMFALAWTKPDGGTIRAEKSTSSAANGVIHAPACVLAGPAQPSLANPADLWYPVEANVKGKTVVGWMHQFLLSPW
jgi:hypothetical protein